MKIAFTICASNYLAKARVLGESLLAHDRDYEFYIFLVDQMTPAVSQYADQLEGIKVVPIEKISIPEFPSLAARYDVIELSTAVKPHCFRYLLRMTEAIEHIFYLDPDIMVFASLGEIEREFGAGSILLTPQIVLPQYTEPTRAEFSALSGGMYNLGFIGLKPSENVNHFLNWWAVRLDKHCRRQPSLGLFYDQSWINFVPIMFDGVSISRHLGLNLAPWNIHERRVSRKGDHFIVNGSHVLVFVHYSHFDHQVEGTIAARDRSCTATYETRPDLAPLYKEYNLALARYGHDKVRRFPYAYERKREFTSIGTMGLLVGSLARFAKRILPRSLMAEARRQLELI